MEPAPVLAYRFGESVRDPALARARGAFWFGASPAVDREIAERASADWRPLLEAYLDAARGHLALIEFGRFPHRNRVLGRESTPLARRQLAAGASGFGQG